MHGLLLIDKSAGMTSHDAVKQIRRIFHTRKVGHAGTLDPLATGVLPIAIGDGTKILQFLLAEDKSYRATFRLGITTDTLDAEGKELLERPIPAISEAILEEIFVKFRGQIEQLPPMFSALKQNGVPLYKLARQGKTVERKIRQVNITRLDLCDYDQETVTIEVDCSKGTYIRSLVSDIGEQLGCGAHLIALRRLQSGIFPINECFTLDELSKLDEPHSALLSLDEALRDFPVVQLDIKAANSLTFGIPPELSQIVPIQDLNNGDIVRLQIDNKLAAIAKFNSLRDKEKRGDFELIKVFVSH